MTTVQDDRAEELLAAKLADGVEWQGSEANQATNFSAQMAVLALRADGLQSVAERGWLDDDNEPPSPRALLTMPESDANGRPVPFMPAGKVAMLAAPGGTGKTQLLVQLAVSVASGKPWLDTYAVADPGPVLLVLGEEDSDEMHRRIRGAVRAMGAWHLAPQIAANLHALGLCGQPAGLTEADGKTTAFYEKFRKGLAAWPDVQWRLIILDPASRFLGPDAEKDNAAATRWIEAVERLTIDLPGKPAVLFAHHTNKSALGGETDQGAARGSSALTDGVRWQANLERVPAAGEEPDKHGKIAKHDPLRVTLRVVKANHCRVQDPLRLVRDEHNGGYLKPDSDAPATRTIKPPLDRVAGQRAVVRTAEAELAAFDLVADGDPVERKRLARKAESAKTALVRMEAQRTPAVGRHGGGSVNRFE